MPPRLPPLDDQTLARLRSLVQAVAGRDARQTPLSDMVRLADDVPVQASVTIDFDAARELGHPMVVLRVSEAPSPSDALTSLSRREREVVALIAEGLSNKQIASRLFVALATVKDHVHRILEKTGLANRAALAAAWHGRPAEKTDRAIQ